MLKHTLCCLRGLSPDAERRLWREGCLTWDQLPHLAHRLVSARKVADLVGQLPMLRAALDGRVADVFLKRLPTGHRTRVWPEFAASTGYLDIETAGLGSRDAITVIGLHVGGTLHQYVRGRDLDNFLRVWRRVELLVTFSGASFDLPRLARAFGLTSSPPHLDLRTEARACGLAGGLKEIENALGWARDEQEQGNGAQAAEWWQEYERRGDGASLERLLHYNARDVASLERLLNWLWRRSMGSFPDRLPEPCGDMPGGGPSSSLTIESIQPVV
jgi:uncharacterized protein YprB with RNaseH-like and TPR domain